MSAPMSAMPLVRRVVREHRRLLVPLVLALVVNLIGYVAVVAPLAQRVATITERDQAAEQALQAARREHADAAGTLTGKDRAATELTTFYQDVLPQDLAGARRLTHLRLPQLARQAGLRFERGTYEPVEERDSSLTRLRIEMVLAGAYADVRTFVHALEMSPEFVVIDNMELSEGAQTEGALVVTLQLSTYYRTPPR